MSELLAPGDAEHPVRIVGNDDLGRSRVTVFFRLLLVLPHGLWLALYGIAAELVLVAAWLSGLALGRIPEGLHRFLERYLRYRLYVGAYLDLAADPFPPFNGAPGAYPVDLEIDLPGPQSRLTILFRGVLAIPALIISAVLGSLLGVVSFFGWFYALVLGRLSPGMQKVLLYGLRYQAQTNAYAFLLTRRYPAL